MLRRTDLENCVVEIVDTLLQDTPFAYLLKLDEEHFLSYSTSAQEDSSVASNVYLYNIDGSKSLLISENYVAYPEADDEGILIEQLLLSGDRLCGIGRRNVNGETKYYAYYYTLEGEYIVMSELSGLDKILGTTSMYDVELNGRYLVFRSYDSMTSYVCEITDRGIRVIAKGTYLSLCYGVTDEYIFFTKSHTQLDPPEVVLYILKTETGEIVKVNFPLPFEKAYISSLMSTSEGGIRLYLCDEESVNVMEAYYYYLTDETIASKVADLF